MYGLKPIYTDKNIRSGPGFIDKSNIDTVIKFAGQYR